jgi:hypothetical protein
MWKLKAVRDLEGCRIVARDGQSLGVITEDASEAESIINDSGKYGSEKSEISIFNSWGKYGCESREPDSPFNKHAGVPPRIFSVSGKFVAYLTLDKAKTPSVNPWDLRMLRRDAMVHVLDVRASRD